MSQKKRVRVYKPGQMGNPLNSWFMQMGGIPQQPQQQDMSAQVMQYAQQMIMEGEDPNNVYDDLVNQGVPSQLAAQVIEQLMESMPPQPAYSQLSQEEAMYNQEVEGAEEAVPDYLSLTGFDEDDDDDDFKKGGITKNKFIKEYKKLKLGGKNPNDIPGEQSNDFLVAVQNEANNYKIQKEAEEMYNNPFAVNPLAPFVYGGSLPKAQTGPPSDKLTEQELALAKQFGINDPSFDVAGTRKQIKQMQRENYIDELMAGNNNSGRTQAIRNYQQGIIGYGDGRYNIGMNEIYGSSNPYLYGNPYGRGYGNVPTMFNPYGRRSPIIQRSPYLNNFPGADFQGMQLSNFKIEPHNVERLKPFRFLGPKTKYTWSGEWTRNPQTGATTPAAGTTSATTPAASTTTNTNNTISNTANTPAATSNVETPPALVTPTINPAKTSPELPDAFKEYQLNDFINNNKDFFSNVGKMMQQGGYLFQPGGDVPERMTPILPNYGDLMAATPGLANPTIDDKFIMDDKIKNAYTIDIPAAYDLGMHGALSFTNSLNNNMEYRDSLANSMGMVAGPEESGQRGNYTVNQSDTSSNFRPDLDGQDQFAQYGGQFELGEETEMTDEEIEKFLKGGGKLRFV
jgi:hypothetical protein